jgi:ABC-type transport system substrate-binding protein
MTRRIPSLLLAVALLAGLTGGYRQVHAARSADTPTSGGTLVIASHPDISHVDPAVGYDTFSWSVERAVFNGLLNYVGATASAGTKIVPDLAAAMPTLSNGGKTYTFKLRHGVMFQAPVSREVTADDVVYSLRRMLDANPATGRQVSPMVNGPFWSGVVGIAAYWTATAKAHHPANVPLTGIKKIDTYTVEIDLTTPNVAFLNILTMPFTFIVPHEVADKPDFDHHAVGTGPFMLKEWKNKQYVDLVKNPNYYVKGVPYLDGVHWETGVTEEVEYLRWEKGTIDLPVDVIPSSDFAQITTSPKYKQYVISAPNVDLYYLGMNTQMAPFKGNLPLRQAIAYAVNRKRLVKILNGRIIANYGFLPTLMPGYDPTFREFAYDPAMAQQKLAAAEKLGYDPKTMPLTLWTITSLDDEKIANSVQQDLAAIGITMKIKEVTADVLFTAGGQPGKVAFQNIGWIQDFPDPSDFYDPILSCASAIVPAGGSGTNVAFVCDKQTDTMADQARGDTDTTQRLKLYQQIQKQMWENDTPWVSLYSDIAYQVTSARVHGAYIHPVWPWAGPFDNMWVTGGASTNPAG